ncbi:MAG: SGNH/GDSL hydrolase family protein [Xanthobacteraceae bacterium]
MFPIWMEGNYGQHGMKEPQRLQTLMAGLRRAWLARSVAGLAVLSASGATAQTLAKPSDAEICLTANENLSLGSALPRTTVRLDAGATVRIVAIGSSSTTGLWMARRTATYPEVMRRELARLRPSARIEVVNSGRIGETIGGSIARFERDVLAYGPDLVVWQLGTNDVTWGGRAGGAKERVVAGVRRLKAAGADVILMDLQYAPLVLASSRHSMMETIIADVARQERIGLFPRFELMRRSIDAGLSPRALVAWDGLHNSAAGYDCIGRALARAIHTAGR